MKTQVLLGFLGLILALRLTGNTFAQSYNFETYSVDDPLSTQPDWSSSDTNADPLDRPDGVAVDAQGGGNFYILNSSNNTVGILGGFLLPDSTPTGTTTLLSAAVTSAPSVSSPILRFRWAQNILNAAPDDGVRDRFGWTIRKTNGGTTSDLVALMLDPKHLLTEDQADKNTLLARAYNGSAASLGNAITVSSVQSLARGAPYSFEILLDTSANLWSARVGNSPDYLTTTWSTIVANATLGLSSGDVVSQFSATWILESSNPNNAGENVMAFDNIQIDTVPEPSSLSLFTFGALALLASRRRRSS